MAHFRLLRQPYITHSLPVVIYQPVLCIGQYRAGSLVLQKQGVQIHCYPQLCHSNHRRHRSCHCRIERSGTVCFTHHPDRVEHIDLYYLIPPLSPTSTHDVRAIIHSEDLLLFRLPVSIQCYLLFQQEFRQTADRQTYGNVRPRILREVLPPHDASLAEYHTSGHSGDAPYLQ